MSKKKINVDSMVNELEGASLYFKKRPISPSETANEGQNLGTPVSPKLTPKSTRERDILRKVSSDNSRKKERGNLRDFPSRDEIQEFSFRLRDDLKVKVQAEVPHEWQDELEEIARKLDVKKLELYRYILGEFLGKVKRKD